MSPTTKSSTAVHRVAGCHWPMLGTVVETSVSADERSEAELAERVLAEEIARLERTFSVFDPDSMLRRWMTDPATATSAEFDQLLRDSLEWQRRSGGAFNVDTGHLRERWARAENETPPGSAELQELCAPTGEPPYRFDQGRPHQVRDCTGVDLNAIAKGFIVDSAIEAARRRCDIVDITVNAGGDIAHRGPTPVQVGVADPLSRLDNAPPLFTIDVDNAAVATSGASRRGVEVSGRWISHIIDPRTGQPAHTSASVTVLAAGAATADVVATIVSVMEPGAGLAFVRALNRTHPLIGARPIECWIVDLAGDILSSDRLPRPRSESSDG